MPIQMNCPSCGKPLSAPDTAVGKKAKCPACGQIMTVPGTVHDAEELAAAPQPSTPSSPQSSPDSAESWLDGLQSPDAAATTPGAGGEARRPCPMCGEMIAAGAPKCRFCGAVFDPRLRGSGSSMQRGQSQQGLAITSMVLGILSLCGCFGPVSGIAAVIIGVVAGNGMKRSKNFEGKGMATAGVVMGIIGAILWTIIMILYVVLIVTAVNAQQQHQFR